MVSAGDYGYTAANWPANLRSVTSVGGTELHRAANARGWSETTWNNGWGAGGSGCSAYVPKPSWQPATDCSMRTVADVSAAAFNIPVYNTVYGGWVTVAARVPPRPSSPGSTAWPATAPPPPRSSSTPTRVRCSTSPRGTTTGSRAARERPAVSIPSASPARLRRPHRPGHPPRNRSLLRPGRRCAPPPAAAAHGPGRGTGSRAHGRGPGYVRPGRGPGRVQMRGRNRYGARQATLRGGRDQGTRAMQGQPAHAARTPAAAIKVRPPSRMCNTVCMTSGRIIIGRRVGT